jgi:hypothetical protein
MHQTYQAAGHTPIKVKSGHLLGRLFLALGLLAASTLSNAQATTIFPISTNAAFVEFGLSAAFDGSSYLAGIQGDAVAHDRVTAQLISADGSLIAPRISTGEEGGVPRVAFDGTNYLMVWEGAGTRPGFHGQFIDKSGALVGPLLTMTTTELSELSITYGGGKYLTCWSDDNTVYGRLVLPSGEFFGASFAISGATERARENGVAFDGTNFLVVFNGGGVHRANIYGQFVSQTGELVNSRFLIDGSPAPSDNPLGVVFGGTNYLVVFNDEVDGSDTGTWDIFGRLVTTGGSVLPDRVTITEAADAQLFPMPVFDGSNYLVTWSHAAGGTNSNMILRFFSTAGEAIGPEFSVLTTQGIDRPVLGAALFDGNRFLVVGTVATLTNGFEFVSGDVYGAFLPRSTAAPRLEVAGPLVGAHFPLLLTGTPGISYTIQAITNLGSASWTTLVTDSSASGSFTFTDPNATNATRFYRTVKQ